MPSWLNRPKIERIDMRLSAVGIEPGLWYITDPNSAFVGWVCRQDESGLLVTVRYGTDEDRRKASRPLLEGTPAT